MRTEICERFGIDYPIFVFTPSEKVAAAVTRAGGLGVLGCVRFNDADDLENVLQWMDANTDGKPYGVDVVMPAKVPTEGSAVDINKLIPQTHRDFVAKTLADLGVPPLPEDEDRNEGVLGWLHSVARSHVDVALKRGAELVLVINPMVPIAHNPRAGSGLLGKSDRLRDHGLFTVYDQTMRMAIKARLHQGLRRWHRDIGRVLDQALRAAQLQVARYAQGDRQQHRHRDAQ